ncbi:MAG: ABC transporter substrate-binding protein [Geminicoccaceae bacterium]|nr:ABC transporter substrate-binding protein [Geminicoccaceae bacterium]
MRRLSTSLLALAVMAGAAAGDLHASEIKVGFTLDALTLDPANHRKRETETILRNMYDGVVTRDANMQVVPQLAESFTQVDPTTWEAKLRSGVTFHDGSPLTAGDVAFTFHRLIDENAMDGQTSPRKGLLGPLVDVEAVDDSTVRFRLSEPWPILPAMLPFQEVVSKSFTEAAGPGGLAERENGTGPFRLAEWRKGEAVIMDRYDDYYGGSTEIPPVGPACVERAIFQIIPESSSRVAALLAGDVDIINELPPSDIATVENSDNAKVMTVNGTRSFYIALNMEKPPFDNVKVREALAHAIDKQLVIDKILNGLAVPIEGILSPDAFAFDPALAGHPYDPDKTASLLEEAGLGDGIDVTMDVEGAFKDIAEAVASLLTKAGIRTTVQVGEGSQLVDKWRTEGAKVREGDMWFTSWGNGTLDPYDIFNPVLMTDARGNSSGYANPELDGLLTAASTETDADKRMQLYIQAQDLVQKDVPMVFLWVPQDVYGVSKRVSGWQPSADSRINLHDACVDG